MKLSPDDRRDLEDAVERLEGVHRRTSQVETRLALEAVQRVLERDDHPAVTVTLHHQRPLVPDDQGRAWGGR